MGMSASFDVNGESVDCYKCSERWICNSYEKDSLSVKYWYETGYGEVVLAVYLRTPGDESSIVLVHDEPNELKTFNLLEECKSQQKLIDIAVPFVIAVKLINPDYGSRLSDDPLSNGHVFNDAVHLSIRSNPLEVLKSNVNTVEAVIDFVRSFVMVCSSSEDGLENLCDGYTIAPPTPEVVRAGLTDEETSRLIRLVRRASEDYYDRRNAPPAIKMLRAYFNEIFDLNLESDF